MLPDDVINTLDMLGLEPLISRRDRGPVAVYDFDHGFVVFGRGLTDDDIRDQVDQVLTLAAAELRAT